MTSREVLKKINENRKAEHIFVRWTRRENDFADYDLVDRFIDNLSSGEEIGDVDLITMDEMWHEIKRISKDTVRLNSTTSGETVEWRHKGKDGVTTQICPYTASTLMTIFDVETRGNAIS
jgi:hypothetical protein